VSQAAAPVLEARELSRDYGIRRGLMRGTATLHAVADVSFTLAAGSTLAVVGESGCGKSTLARMVAMIEPPSRGTLKVAGTEVVGASASARRALRPVVQMVFQNPFGSLNPRKKIGTILEEPLTINTSLDRAARQEAARAMMAKVGLRPEHYGRYPHMFSGGQRQRIAIARALMLHPRIVIADEPVSALDVSIRAQVLNLLMDLQAELDLAYLFISHDLGVVRHIANEIVVMYLGRIVEFGPRETVFAHPRHPYTLALLASTPAVDPGSRSVRVGVKGELPSPLDPPAGCAFHKRCAFAAAECARSRPPLRRVDGRLVACHFAETVG